MRAIHGLDISKSDLAEATVRTSPEETSSISYRSVSRWEDLEVKLWEGGLEAYNQEFKGIECITAMEVIEHIPDNILPLFAPMLLGTYRPRLFLVTTPSYTFNARFTAPGHETDRRGYPDPTGRTDRVFRHDDHKFEWTVEEFSDWCHSAASQWGYDVTIAGVGKAQEPDPWGRDDAVGFASQVALFRRRDDITPSANTEKTEQSEQPQHTLVCTHVYPANSSARSPKSLKEIMGIVDQTVAQFEGRCTLRDLWVERVVSEACGGWIELLIEALMESDTWALDRTTSASRMEWNVSVRDGVELQFQPTQLAFQDEDSDPWRESGQGSQLDLPTKQNSLDSGFEEDLEVADEMKSWSAWNVGQTTLVDGGSAFADREVSQDVSAWDDLKPSGWGEVSLPEDNAWVAEDEGEVQLNTGASESWGAGDWTQDRAEQG